MENNSYGAINPCARSRANSVFSCACTLAIVAVASATAAPRTHNLIRPNQKRQATHHPFASRSPAPVSADVFPTSTAPLAPMDNVLRWCITSARR